MSLPLDLQMMLLDNLTWQDYVAFALAGYSDLQLRHADRFPRITRYMLAVLRSTSAANMNDPLSTLPNEMIEHIARYIDRRALMNWVFAHYPTLSARRLVPPMTWRNVTQIYLAWLRRTS